MSNVYIERSPDYLEHHGILGQKWGVRRYQNPDGSLTEAGKERYRLKNKKQASKLKEEYENMFNWKNRNEKNIDKMFEMTGASKEVLKEVKKYSKEYADKIDNIGKEADELFKGFDEETRTFYEASSELAENSLYYSKDPKESTLEEIGWAGFMGCLEDGQQQSVNANSMYANEKGIVDQCIKLDDEYSNAFKEYREKAGQATSQAFEEVGANIQIYEKNPNYKLGEAIISSSEYAITRNHKTDNFYKVMDAGYKYSDSETKAVNEAKEIISRIEGHKDHNTWWYFGEAAENLGMDQIKAADMSQSDWDRINAEIRKLRSLNHSAFEDSDYYLEHHGILGQKWGVRRYQNPDGSLTAEGRRRYGDILTPDQMKNMIKSYNIRTGSNKKINKHTVFKTKRGLYDYKGRKLDDNTDVDDPGLQNAKKSKADKKAAKEAARKAEMEANKKTPTNKDFRKMSDEELAATVQRMRNEAEFLRLDSQINPKKVSIGKEMANNLRDNLVKDIPAGLSGLVKNSIQNLAAQQDKDKDKDKGGGGDKGNNNSDKSNNNSSNSTNSSKPSNTGKSNESKPSGSVSSDKSTFSNLFGDKDSNLAYNMGKSVSELSNGIRNMKSDVKESYDKGRNFVQTNRSNMLEKALNDAGFSDSRSSKAYSAIKAASVGAVSQGRGSKYDTQDFWNKTVKDISNSYYEAEAQQFMKDYGLKALDETDNWRDQFKPKKYD